MYVTREPVYCARKYCMLGGEGESSWDIIVFYVISHYANFVLYNIYNEFVIFRKIVLLQLNILNIFTIDTMIYSIYLFRSLSLVQQID